ncbi:MAG: hypothetical protein IJ783_07395, partial [Kiritimatiellae bacterium]|nr:hypothetical protein [Kiritimatiellia bacterium]
TNGMGEAWWNAPATVTSNVVSALFTPEMDPGAPVAAAYFGIRSGGGRGTVYRAFATLRFAGSPGAVPNALPAPQRVLDLAGVAVTNTPFALLAEAGALWANDAEVLHQAADFTEAQDRALRSDIANLHAASASAQDARDNAQNVHIDAVMDAALEEVRRLRDDTCAAFGFLTGSAADAAAAQDARDNAQNARIDALAERDTVATARLNAHDAGLWAITNGLVPEYIVAPETARGTLYTGVSRDTALRDGKLILYYIGTQPSAAWSIDLVLADGARTGPVPVRFWGTTAAGTQASAGSILPLVYKGGAWYWSDRDANDNYYERLRVSGQIRTARPVRRYSVCGADTNGLGYCSLDPGVAIDATRPLLYNARTAATTAAGTASTDWYYVYPCGTNFEIDRKFPGKQGSPLYILGTLSDDGKVFTVGDPMFSYTPVPPCFPIGYYHPTSTNMFYFVSQPLLLPPAVPATRKIGGVALDADIPLAGGLVATNGALRVYDAAPDGTLSNLLWDSASAADTATVRALDRRVAALERGGGAASWAEYDATGADNPDNDTVMLNRPVTSFASGFQWATSGAYHALATSGAVAFVAEDGGEMRLYTTSITNSVGITLGGGVVTVGCNAEGFEVANGIATITYPYSGGAYPTIYGAATLAGPWTQMSGATWVADAAAGTARASFPATGDAFFFRATTAVQQSEYWRARMPSYLEGGVMTSPADVAPVVYDSVITITQNGHTYRLPAQRMD